MAHPYRGVPRMAVPGLEDPVMLGARLGMAFAFGL